MQCNFVIFTPFIIHHIIIIWLKAGGEVFNVRGPLLRWGELLAFFLNWCNQALEMLTVVSYQDHILPCIMNINTRALIGALVNVLRWVELLASWPFLFANWCNLPLVGLLKLNVQGVSFLELWTTYLLVILEL